MGTAKFSPGVRLSSVDVFVLVAGTAGVASASTMTWWYGLVSGFVLAHFFLFCNVFRVSRPLELLWAGAFVTLVVTTILWNVPGWWPTTLGSVCVAALVVAVEMRKPSYHGVGWRRINPGLPDWWEARATKVKGAGPETPLDANCKLK